MTTTCVNMFSPRIEPRYRRLKTIVATNSAKLAGDPSGTIFDKSLFLFFECKTQPNLSIICESPCCTLLSCSCTVQLLPPDSGSPHVRTDLSARIEANAQDEAQTCCTFLSWSCTAELSPPHFSSPHVTTDPSVKTAAMHFLWIEPLDIPQVLLHCRAITAILWIAPCHH